MTTLGRDWPWISTNYNVKIKVSQILKLMVFLKCHVGNYSMQLAQLTDYFIIFNNSSKTSCQNRSKVWYGSNLNLVSKLNGYLLSCVLQWNILILISLIFSRNDDLVKIIIAFNDIMQNWENCIFHFQIEQVSFSWNSNWTTPFHNIYRYI